MSDKQPKQNSFFGGAAILAAGILIVKVIGAIYKIPIVNVLGSSYADFQNAYYIYALLLVVSTAGLPVALSKMVAAANARGPLPLPPSSTGLPGDPPWRPPKAARRYNTRSGSPHSWSQGH